MPVICSGLLGKDKWEMSEKKLDKNTTIAKLLEKYPNGFSVSCSGAISKIILATSYFTAIAKNQDKVPLNGGYLIVDMTDEKMST